MDKPNWRSKEFLTVKDIKEILGVHLNTAYKLVNEMTHIVLGKNVIRVQRTVFEKWLKDKERMISR